MKIILFFILLSFTVLSQDNTNESVKLDAIKDILKNDNLEKYLQKQQIIKKKEVKKKENENLKYFIPNVEDIRSFIVELWLVKNAPILKWDFEKPDFGLDETFASILQKVGFYEINFKILVLNNPAVTHFGFQGTNEYYFLVSLPFIRQMDLSKPEICLLMLEDFFRSRAGYVEKNIFDEETKKLLGTNLKTQKDAALKLPSLLKKIDKIVFEKGFSFQQQFDVTSQMSKILKGDMTLWDTYYLLIKKIDNLVKSNALYSEYVKIYPSPEMQLKWLAPK